MHDAGAEANGRRADEAVGVSASAGVAEVVPDETHNRR